VSRDLSIVVASTLTHDDLVRAVVSAGAPLVRSVRLWDIYKPAGASAAMFADERSLTLRMELLDDDVTLTEEKIDTVRAAVVAALQRQFGARLRA